MKKKVLLMIITLLLVSYIEPVIAMEVVECGGIGGVPYVILKFIGRIINIIKIIVPIILIIMGIIDMAKATTANDDKKMQTASKMFIKRTLYALVVFFVIAIVQFIFEVFETSVTDKEHDLLGCVSCVLGNECETKEFEPGVSKSDTSGNAGDENKKKTVKVTKVVITSKKTEMKEGETYTISAKAMPNNATNKKLTYKSSNTSVATINSKGKIKAKKAGTTTITVKSANNKKESFKLTVIKETTGSENKNTSSSIGGFTYYNQGDYSNVAFCNGGKNLQSSGCGAVSFAMVATNLVNSSYNPKAVANWLCSNGHNGGALPDYWYTKSKFTDKFGLNSIKIVGNIGNDSSKIKQAKKKITQELNNGKMIILYIPGHYVVLGSGGTDKVVLLDPGKRANNGTYTIDKVYDMTKNYKNRCSSSGNCGWHGAYSFSKK